MVEWILGRADDARGPDLLAAFKRRYDTEGVALTQAFPGASEVLAVLATRSSQLTIVSNKRALPTARILDALGWTTYFGAVRCSDSKGCAGLDKIARVAALRPALGECVLVGDTREDYHAASRNGIAFIAADYGYETDPAAFAALAAFKRMAAPQELAELADLKR